MTVWAAWFPDLLPHVPGVPAIVAEFELRRAAQAFFEATRGWKVVKPAAAVTAGTQDIAVAPASSEQELVRVETAWYDGVEIDPTTVEDLDAAYGTDWNTQTGTPSHFFQRTPGTLSLFPLPLANATTGLKLRLSVRPSESATGIPDELYIKHRDAITAGAKSRLMLYPNKPWSNADMGMLMGQVFDGMAGKANAAAARSFADARKRARPKWC